MARYCLDANVLIEAKNGPYAFDIVPGFWTWLDRMADARKVYSIRAVYDEITEGNDELCRWAKDRRDSGLFVDPSSDVQLQLGAIADHVVGAYERHQAEAFLAGADPWVVAQAKVDGSTVVTREKLAGPGTRQVKIPNVCQVFGVKFVDTYAMLRAEGARFQ